MDVFHLPKFCLKGDLLSEETRDSGRGTLKKEELKQRVNTVMQGWTI